MRIKGLFTVPEGKKITEKMFGRVLASSVCGMLLCMACLAGTTWAWFATTVENTDNVIQTAAAPNYTLKVDGEDFTSGAQLPAGDHSIQVTHNSAADDLLKKSKLYVVFTINDAPYGYIILGGDQPSSVIVILENNAACTLSWAVSWYPPGNTEIQQLTDNVINILTEEEPEESTEPEASTDPSESTEPSTEATEPSTEATEPSTEATEPSTEATEPSTEATEPSTEATEPSTEATEPSTEATEPSTEATEPSTEATEPSTEATEPQASEPDPTQGES